LELSIRTTRPSTGADRDTRRPGARGGSPEMEVLVRSTARGASGLALGVTARPRGGAGAAPEVAAVAAASAVAPLPPLRPGLQRDDPLPRREIDVLATAWGSPSHVGTASIGSARPWDPTSLGTVEMRDAFGYPRSYRLGFDGQLTSASGVSSGMKLDGAGFLVPAGVECTPFRLHPMMQPGLSPSVGGFKSSSYGSGFGLGSGLGGGWGGGAFR
jgi:hypothetical protein